MKICRDISYESFGITEETGWKASYDWEKLRKVLKKVELGVTIFSVFSLLILVNTVFKEHRTINIVLSLGVVILIYIFILTPIHEILHLFPIVRFKFDDKCYILINKKTVSAFYAGEISKKQHTVMIIMPFFVLGLIISISIIFSSGIVQFCLVIILFMHISGCYSDIYMFFYIHKNFPSNTIFYGNRYRLK